MTRAGLCAFADRPSLSCFSGLGIAYMAYPRVSGRVTTLCRLMTDAPATGAAVLVA